MKPTQKQLAKVRQLALLRRHVASQCQARSASGRETNEFRMPQEARLREITPPLDSLRRLHGVTPAAQWAGSPRAQELARLEAEGADLAAAIDEAKAEAARLHAEADRLNTLAGSYREVVEEVAKRAQSVELLNLLLGTDTHHMPPPPAGPAREFGAASAVQGV
jgi:hypothetical protein